MQLAGVLDGQQHRSPDFAPTRDHHAASLSLAFRRIDLPSVTNRKPARLDDRDAHGWTSFSDPLIAAKTSYLAQGGELYRLDNWRGSDGSRRRVVYDGEP